MMARRFAHWVLLFSLLGQFLLTPAMALPDQLHRLGQVHLQEPLQQSAILLNSELSIADSSGSVTDASATQIDSSLFSNHLFSLVAEFGEQVSASLCEASCQMLSSGHCTTHSQCTAGLDSNISLLLNQDITTDKIESPAWSVKSALLQIVMKPPIV
ncbi:conserved hypothetical protein [Shewanella halifaxensis HAW-EB4]|uniref:Uncharacterized protein n=2 Tax=Shewanella halifaxensis TaxID=271098 RepID=B0TVM4_SHEHH|nr:conserved hypothetical protein [Shewanella halifaxensis HAW-EB4]